MSISYFLLKTNTWSDIERLNFRIFYSKKSIINNQVFRGLLQYINVTFMDYLLMKDEIENKIRVVITERLLHVIGEKISRLLMYSLDRGKILFEKIKIIFEHPLLLTFNDEQKEIVFSYIKSLSKTLFDTTYIDEVDKYHTIYELYVIVGKPNTELFDTLIRDLSDPKSCLNEVFMDELFHHCVSILKYKDVEKSNRDLLFSTIKNNIAFKKDRMMVLFICYFHDRDQKHVIDLFYQYLISIVSNISQYVNLMNGDQKMTEKALKNMIVNIIKLHSRKHPNKSKFMLHKLFIVTYKHIDSFLDDTFFRNLIRFYFRRFKTWNGIINLFNKKNNYHVKKIIISIIIQEFNDLSNSDIKYLHYSMKQCQENSKNRNMYKLSA